MSRKSCPKCQAAMVEGVILDSKESGGRGVSRWLEGAPVRSFFFGIKLQGRKPVLVQTYRCSRCSFLESYAPE